MNATHIVKIALPILALALIVVLVVLGVQNHGQHEQAKQLAGRAVLANSFLLGPVKVTKDTQRVEEVNGVSYTVTIHLSKSGLPTASAKSSADGFTYTVGSDKGEGSCLGLLCYLSR